MVSGKPESLIFGNVGRFVELIFFAVTLSVLRYIYVVMPGQINRNELERLSRKDPAAIEQWFRRYADAVFTFIYYKIGRDSDLARDIVQDTFLEGIAKMAQYDPKKASMLMWLLLISRNHIKKALRAKKRDLRNICIHEQDSVFVKHCKNLSSDVIPEDILHAREMAELVQSTLGGIPAAYREVLRLHYYNGDSIKKIADSRQVTEGAAKVLLHRARKSFEKAFEKLAGNSDFTDAKVR
jgi:RNA polymerase sigma-70 factor (ECF subfamily)